MRSELERYRFAVRATELVRAMAIIALTLGGSAARAESVQLDGRCLRVAFEVSGWGIGRIKGRFEDVWGTLDFDRTHVSSTRLRITASTQSIRTQSVLVDAELRSTQFFDAVRFPQVSFESSGVELFAERAGTVTGVLEMRGVARSIRIPFELVSELFKPSPSPSIPHLQANVTIRRSAWGMSALVPLISDDVKLDIRTGCSD